MLAGHSVLRSTRLSLSLGRVADNNEPSQRCAVCPDAVPAAKPFVASGLDTLVLRPVVVPLVRGLTVKEATGLLAPLGLQLAIAEVRNDPKIPENQIIYADRDLVDVIIRNVLNNAIKFSNSGDSITLFSEVEEDRLILCVLDQGIGMNPSQVEKLLSNSYSITKSTPGTQKEKGSGLGLQLVKEFVKKTGGEIEVESTPKHGTKFCIKFPTKELP